MKFSFHPSLGCDPRLPPKTTNISDSALTGFFSFTLVQVAFANSDARLFDSLEFGSSTLFLPKLFGQYVFLQFSGLLCLLANEIDDLS